MRIKLRLALLMIPALFPVTASFSSAQHIQVQKDQILILHLVTPTGDVEQSNGTAAYRVIIQCAPFVEVQLVDPLPVDKVHRDRMVFACEEVGMYTDGSTDKDWTIGKKCRLH
jgi:hypothetical protein